MIKRSKPDPLRAGDLKRFEKLLLAKRREILGIVSTMENEALRGSRTDLSNTPYHMADMGSDNYERDNTLGLMASERRILNEIDDALAHPQPLDGRVIAADHRMVQDQVVLTRMPDSDRVSRELESLRGLAGSGRTWSNRLEDEAFAKLQRDIRPDVDNVAVG